MQALLPPRRRLVISLTALIDVVFILLMFFMLTSSFVKVRSLEMQAPVASDSKDTPDPELLLINSAGAISRFGGELLASHYKQLDAQALARLEPGKGIVLVPAADVTVQALVTTLETLKAAGFNASLGDSQPDVEVSP